MSGKRIQDEGTLQLQRELVTCYKKHDRTLEATPLNPLVWLFRNSRARGLFKKGQRIKDVLAERYEGVILQMFNRVGITSAASIRSTWFSAQRRFLTLSDARKFTTALWDALSERPEVSESLLAPLKHKFMLRQFVDEIEDGDSRTALRIIAYSSLPVDLTTQESFSLFYRALPFLHEQVLRHSAELDVLTDGIITESFVRTLRPPYEQYRIWLLKA